MGPLGKAVRAPSGLDC